ncbi:hypothetical protein HAX54_008238, partial [Datura stramonium]|nr:hypothetical protein [Datura stramonium]
MLFLHFPIDSSLNLLDSSSLPVDAPSPVHVPAEEPDSITSNDIFICNDLHFVDNVVPTVHETPPRRSARVKQPP